jgi:hypothetical protein
MVLLLLLLLLLLPAPRLPHLTAHATPSQPHQLPANPRALPLQLQLHLTRLAEAITSNIQPLQLPQLHKCGRSSI